MKGLQKKTEHRKCSACGLVVCLLLFSHYSHVKHLTLKLQGRNRSLLWARNWTRREGRQTVGKWLSQDWNLCSDSPNISKTSRPGREILVQEAPESQGRTLTHLPECQLWWSQAPQPACLPGSWGSEKASSAAHLLKR